MYAQVKDARTGKLVVLKRFFKNRKPKGRDRLDRWLRLSSVTDGVRPEEVEAECGTGPIIEFTMMNRIHEGKLGEEVRYPYPNTATLRSITSLSIASQNPFFKAS